jgi:hypothetical protein
MSTIHESFERAEDLQVGPDRAFGLLFAFVFALVAAWPALDGRPPLAWAAALALATLLAALAFPRVLQPANVLWMRLGALLGVVGGFVGLALLYYGAFLPTGLLMRLFGKDPLRRGFARGAASYWIERNGDERRPRGMRDQF